MYSYLWYKPSSSRASLKPFLCYCVSPSPCAEREILPDRDAQRLGEGDAAARELALRELLRDKSNGTYCRAFPPES